VKAVAERQMWDLLSDIEVGKEVDRFMGSVYWKLVLQRPVQSLPPPACILPPSGHACETKQGPQSCATSSPSDRELVTVHSTR
jgi:hypothetical protein